MSAPEQDPIGQDLDEYLAGPDPDYTAPPEAPQDADDANTRLRRLARIRADIAQVEETAARQIEQINAWAERRYEVLHNQARWEQDGLEKWHRAVLAEDPSRKTISLPCGTLKARAQQPEWEFVDETFIRWAQKWAPGLVRVPEPKPQVDRAAVKKALNVPADLQPGESGHVYDSEGDIPPGVTVTVRPPSFSVVTEEVGR